MAANKLVLGDIEIMLTASAKMLHKFVFETDCKRKNRANLRKFSGFDCLVVDSDAYNKKVKFIKDNFRGRDLLMVCTLLGIHSSATSDSLIEEILKYMSDLNLLKEEDDENNEDDDDPGSDDEITKDEARKEGNNDENGNEEEEYLSSKGDKDGSSIKDEGHYMFYGDQKGEMQHQMERCAISFKDVEDTIRTFNGENNYPIKNGLRTSKKWQSY